MKSLSNYLFIACSLILLISSCASSKLISRKEQKSLHQQLVNSPIFAQSYTGFELYDPVSKTVLYEQLSDKYFTPASNTKIFTFYATTKILGDSIPALKYVVQNDSLIFWGTGDPTLLHPFLADNQKVIHFFKTRTEQLFYCPDNFMEARFGPGWSWDDYPYYFQVEQSSMPIYGNVVLLKGKKESQDFTVSPNYFKNKIVAAPELGGKIARFYRQERNNLIDYNQQMVGKNDLEKELPFIYSDSLFLKLLADTLKRPVQLIQNWGIPPAENQTLYSLSTDSVNQRMMQISDNFLAEQLILLVANQMFDTLNTRKGIELIKDSLFSDSPDKLLWFDGSGLSRYNQFTPRSIVRLIEKIYQEIPRERWQAIFPASGHSGTIKKYFGGTPQPYVYAKTGTIRNVRCLSGFVLTRSGRTLIFSFMNNHIPGSSRPWNAEMDKVLRWIYEEL